MRRMEDKFKVTPKLLELGHKLFLEIEPRDSMYRISSFLIERLKSNPFGQNIWITDALLVLLLTWHNAFYRYGTPQNFHNEMKNFIETNRDLLFGNEEISEQTVKEWFKELLDILAITTKRGQRRRSGIAVVKTLHLLNPKIFPLWDEYIAEAYLGNVDTKRFDHYWKFKKFVDIQYEWYKENFEEVEKAKFYKKLDELNYVLFTRSNLSAESLKNLIQLLKENIAQVEEGKNELVQHLESAEENIYLNVLKIIEC